MKNFLVPVDFSAVTDRVIDETLGFAHAFGGKVTLLHVVQPPAVTTGEFAVSPEAVQDEIKVNDQAARVRLAGSVEKFRHAGVACNSDVFIGQPVALILEEAGKTKADYIVMGSHGHGKLYDFLVGSTTSGVLKKARCGVIVLPSEDKHR